MKKILLLPLLFLVACGSSSSQGIHNPTKTEPTKTEPTLDNKINKIDTKGWIVYDDDGEGTFLPELLSISSASIKNLNTITVKGHTIKLKPDDISRKGLYYTKNNEVTSRIVSGRKYGNFTFGAMNGPQIDSSLGNNITSHLTSVFVHGKETSLKQIKVMDGVATYEGDALIVRTGLAGVHQGDVTVTVNFAQKKLGGKLTGFNNNISDVLFSATIVGADFYGHKTNKYNDFNISYGYFYGENANEMGGVIKGTQAGGDYAASFGAKRTNE